MDVKAWIETSGVTVAEDIYIDPPTMPFIVFTDNIDAGYRDLSTKMLTHSVTIELLAEGIDSTSEAAIEVILTDLDNRYTKSRAWSDADNCFVTRYDANFEETE